MARSLIVVLVLAVCSTAGAASLPGVRTPSKNISCFYAPIKPTARGTLLCNIEEAVYANALVKHCGAAPIGLDWGGIPPRSRRRRRRRSSAPAASCTTSTGRQPALVTLAYGKTWRYRGFTCRSRFVGLTCKNSAGHGLFLSRESYRLF